jgi:DNA-binding transcriptional regulator YhcF (GntR family)
MDQAVPASSSDAASEQERSSLSYKFQRLREKLRESIASGELAGKLPGERALAKRFHVNAKTLSKALTDLAAEGLLDRSIGRGTYVKGSAPDAGADRRWLVVCEPHQLTWEIIDLLRKAHPEIETVTDVISLRPSFLNQFSAVVDLASNTPDAFIRDLIVRNIPVVVVGKEPKLYSTHAVVFDGQLAVCQAGRRLVVKGHCNLAAIEPVGCDVVGYNLRSSCSSIAADVTVQSGTPKDVVSLVNHGVTGIVCQSVDLATETKIQLDKAGIAVPRQVSLLAVGSASEKKSISGIYIHRSQKVNAIVQLVTEPKAARPTTVWLAGQYEDLGTCTPVDSSHFQDATDHGDLLEATL